MAYETLISKIKAEIKDADALQIGKVYVLAPSTTAKEYTCNGVYLGKYIAHSDPWVKYGARGGAYKLNESLFDYVYNPEKSAKLVVKKIVAQLTNDDSISTKRKTSKRSPSYESSIWHQFTVNDKRFITDGHTTYCKSSYDLLQEALAEDGCRLRVSFIRWAQYIADDFYNEVNQKYYYVYDQDYYEDKDNDIEIRDFGECSSLHLKDDEYEVLGKKVTSKVLEIRKKYNIN